MRRLIIYCDESDSSGRYFGNFYGGALVRSEDLVGVIRTLEDAKTNLNLFKEVKWQKVTESYLEKYQSLVSTFFDLIHADLVKIRIMFTQNAFEPQNLTAEQRDNEYFLLYYQFLKNAFGLQYANDRPSDTLYLDLNLDELPDSHQKRRDFKHFLAKLFETPRFTRPGVALHQISEVDSKAHVILQCLDIILGSISFRLNDKHLEKPPGQRIRAKRTRAKHALYKHINQLIRRTYPNFNVGASTGSQTLRDRWEHPYRHWNFRSRVHVFNAALTKK